MITNPLYLDSGNTRLKWQFEQRNGVFSTEQELVAFIEQYKIKQIVLASVTTQWTEATINRLVPAVAVHVVTVQDQLMGLELAYLTPSSLGVDRWLNMLAALQAPGKEEMVVVSMGTAMTIDVLQQRKHMGGYIVPGLMTQARSLYQDASALPMVEFKGDIALGSNTQDCINNGILKSLSALVESTVHDMRDAQVIVTGGDSLYLSNSIAVEHTVNQGLVFEGLSAYWREINKDG